MDFSSRPAVSFSDNHGGGGGAEEGGDRLSSSSLLEKWEHMFDKVVTPSDVGKLNRLVIPKQHAEKYFPLDSSSSSGSDKGLLLDFEDRDGKSWRFRYSYWNSSQSYVMTKGWSRFVKDKHLHAGDVVSFHRHRLTAFFIDWRRRPLPGPPPPPFPPYNHIQYGLPLLHHHRSPPFLVPAPGQQQQQPYRGSLITGFLETAAASARNEPISRHRSRSKYGGLDPNLLRPQIYIRGQHQMQIQMQLAAPSSSVPVVPSVAAGKRLRLFGVNMDCSEDHDSEASAAADANVNVNSTEEDEGSLELRLDGSAPVQATPSSSSSMHTTATSDFLEKGKSSMTLDFDF